MELDANWLQSLVNFLGNVANQLEDIEARLAKLEAQQQGGENRRVPEGRGDGHLRLG